MKYIEDLCFGDLAKKIIKQIIAETDPERSYNFLDFCSSHAHPIHRYDLQNYLPDNLTLSTLNRDPKQLITSDMIENTLQIAKTPYVICCSYPELLTQNIHHVGDLVAAKSAGTDVRIVYSVDDAINIAKIYPTRHVVFLAVGFEGEMLNTAKALQYVKQHDIANFSVILEHKTAFNAACDVLDENFNESAVTGLLLPTDFMENGIAQYHALQVREKLPILVSGFEPIDILQSILYLIRQNNANDNSLICQFRHSAATKENEAKQELLHDVFSNQCDPAKAPVAVQEEYLPYVVMFSTSSQVSNFFSQTSDAIENIVVASNNPLSSQLQQ